MNTLHVEVIPRRPCKPLSETTREVTGLLHQWRTGNFAVDPDPSGQHVPPEDAVPVDHEGPCKLAPWGFWAVREDSTVKMRLRVRECEGDPRPTTTCLSVKATGP
jgi:hypothetical protein